MVDDAKDALHNGIDELNTEIRRILLATDGSTPAIVATQYAIALAKAMGASIKAVYVTSDDKRTAEGILDIEVLKEVRPSSAGLDVVQLYAIKNNIECETEVLRGNVAKTIIEIAEEYGADVIIVGNSGRTGLRRLALGSVAEEVVQCSRIPVLVLKGN